MTGTIFAVLHTGRTAVSVVPRLMPAADRNGAGGLQCRSPGWEEGECGGLNRQASVRIPAPPLTSCDLGPVTQPSCMYDSNDMTFQLCDTFFKK